MYNTGMMTAASQHCVEDPCDHAHDGPGQRGDSKPQLSYILQVWSIFASSVS